VTAHGAIRHAGLWRGVLVLVVALVFVLGLGWHQAGEGEYPVHDFLVVGLAVTVGLIAGMVVQGRRQNELEAAIVSFAAAAGLLFSMWILGFA
jgi:hypothetical protein